MSLREDNCECGCGQPAPIYTRTNHRKGHVAGQRARFISGHNRRGTTDLSRYSVLANGCWEWLGSRNHKGYGRAQRNREHTPAHRAMYESVHGELSPEVHLDHLCRHVWCVNPEHLEPVSPAENRRRQADSMLALSDAARQWERMPQADMSESSDQGGQRG